MTDRCNCAASVNESLLRKEIERYKAIYEREKEQFEEFQRYSKELETEMELELKLRDKKVADLELARRRMGAELEGLKSKHETDRREHNATEQEIRIRMEKAELLCADLRQKLRSVEQSNDNLERRERIHAQELVDIGERYEKCLERCAMLEAGMLPIGEQLSQSIKINEDDESMEVVPNADPIRPVPSIRECAQQLAASSESQKLIDQMLRKIEVAEAHISSSPFSSNNLSTPLSNGPPLRQLHNGINNENPFTNS